MIAELHGGTVDIMRPLGATDVDHNPEYHPGEFKEWGAYPVRIVERDPIFAGFGDRVRVQQFHRSEVKTLPACFRVLASTEACRVQAFVHRRKPLYGVQFHPEESTAAYPDGFRILRNFFGLPAARQRRSGCGIQNARLAGKKA